MFKYAYAACICSSVYVRALLRCDLCVRARRDTYVGWPTVGIRVRRANKRVHHMLKSEKIYECGPSVRIFYLRRQDVVLACEFLMSDGNKATCAFMVLYESISSSGC